MLKKTVHIDIDSHEFLRKRAFDKRTSIERETNDIIKEFIKNKRGNHD